MKNVNATSPKSAVGKLGFFKSSSQKSLRVLVLGQTGCGKTALVVRFITRRYIEDYDNTIERIYTFHTIIDNEMIVLEILDSGGERTLDEAHSATVLNKKDKEETDDSVALESAIRWAEAFILMYSVTDKCSFDECHRLKFLINYNKRRRRLGGSSKDNINEYPVVLVGNKIDQLGDRMVTLEEGQKRSKEIGCVCFHEISVRESVDQVMAVFRDVVRFWRVHNKFSSKLRRSVTEKEPISPDTVRVLCSSISPSNLIPASCRPAGRRWTETDLEEEDETENGSNKESTASSPLDSQPFRDRASTDGNLLQKPWRWKHSALNPFSPPQNCFPPPPRTERRMSISLRGTNSSY